MALEILAEDVEFLEDQTMALVQNNQELKRRIDQDAAAKYATEKVKRKKLEKKCQMRNSRLSAMKEEGRLIDLRTMDGKIWKAQQAQGICAQADAERIRLHMRNQVKDGRNVTASAQKFAVLLKVHASLDYTNLARACELFEEFFCGAGEASEGSFQYMTRQWAAENHQAVARDIQDQKKRRHFLAPT